ncbi:unnamed protein product [Closterium sp. NIES-65]|nr:unnamed protein product [Closterium sp. NIES-65]
MVGTTVLLFSTTPTIYEPTTYEQALACLDAPLWIEAMVKESNAFISNRSFLDLLHSAASLLRAVERSCSVLPALQWAALQEVLPRCHSLLAAAASLHRRTRHDGSVVPRALAATAVGLGEGGGAVAAASTAAAGNSVSSPPWSSSSTSPASSAPPHATAAPGACGGDSGGGSSMEEDGAGRHMGEDGAGRHMGEDGAGRHMGGAVQGRGAQADEGRAQGSEDASSGAGCERRAGGGSGWGASAAAAADVDGGDACVPVATSGAHGHASQQSQHAQQRVGAQGDAVCGELPDTVHAPPACTPTHPAGAPAPPCSVSSHPTTTHALVCVPPPPTLHAAPSAPPTDATPCGAATPRGPTVPSFPRFSPFAAADSPTPAAGTPLHVPWAARAAGHRVSHSMDGSSGVASGLSGGARQQFEESRRRQQQAVQACVQALQGGLFSPYGRTPHSAGHAATSRWRGGAAEGNRDRCVRGGSGKGGERAGEEGAGGRRGEGVEQREGNGGAKAGGGWEWGGREGVAGRGEGGQGHERSRSLDVDAMAQLWPPLHHAAVPPHGTTAGQASGGSERGRRGTGTHPIDPTAPAAASPHAHSPHLPPKSPSPQPKGRFPPFPHDATPSPHPPLAHAHLLSNPPFQAPISPHPAAATRPCAPPSSPAAPPSAHPPTLKSEGVGAAEERAVEEITCLFSTHFSAPSAPSHRSVCAAPHGATPHGATPHGATPHGATPHGATPHGATQAQPTPHGTKGCAIRTPHPALSGCAAPQAVHATLNAASHPPPCCAAACPANATGAADSVEVQSTVAGVAGEATPAHDTGMAASGGMGAAGGGMGAAGGGMGAAVPPKPRSRKKMMSRREWL